MLQFQTKNIDICRISKLLVRYNIKASITDSQIILEGDISDEILNRLCDGICINAVQNFISFEPIHIPEETTENKESFLKQVVEEPKNSEAPIRNEIIEEPEDEKNLISSEIVEEPEMTDISKTNNTLKHNTREYNLIYSEVKRGEVYLCDFGQPYGREQGFERYAIVIQNDVGNLNSPTTIVIACTTEKKKELPVHYKCIFSSENMIDYNKARVGSKENIILAEQIKTIDKRRLCKYLGTLRPEFMEELQKKIDLSLSLKRKIKRVFNNEKIIIDTPISVSDGKMVVEEKQKERHDINSVQIQLLSNVDIKRVLEISQSNSTDEIKTEEILKLFGFDLNRNGVQYLLKAIIISPKDSYFNIETLSKDVSEKEGINKEEIKRLIVARVKEKFGFKKAPTIDLIRLINSFLLKQEDKE